MVEKVEYIVIARGEENKFRTESDALNFAKSEIKGQENFDLALILIRSTDAWDNARILSVQSLRWIIDDAFIIDRVDV